MKASRTFYAWESQAKGAKIFQFNSLRERENWLYFHPRAIKLPAREVDRAFRAEGTYVRWGHADPRECNPVQTTLGEVAGLK